MTSLPIKIIQTLRKLLGMGDAATDEEVEARAEIVFEALAVAIAQKQEGDGAKNSQALQDAEDAKAKANNLVRGRDDSGAIQTVHKDSPDAKKLRALSADAGLASQIRTFSAAAGRITPLESDVMKRLGLSEAQWLSANS